MFSNYVVTSTLQKKRFIALTKKKKTLPRNNKPSITLTKKKKKQTLPQNIKPFITVTKKKKKKKKKEKKKKKKKKEDT